jgi:hypothetical protein
MMFQVGISTVWRIEVAIHFTLWQGICLYLVHALRP